MLKGYNHYDYELGLLLFTSNWQKNRDLTQSIGNRPLSLHTRLIHSTLLINLRNDFAQGKQWMSFWQNYNIWRCWLADCCMSSEWHVHLFLNGHDNSDSYSRYHLEWTPWPLIRFWLKLRLLWSMTRNPRNWLLQPFNKLIMMLMYLRAESFALVQPPGQKLQAGFVGEDY